MMTGPQKPVRMQRLYICRDLRQGVLTKFPRPVIFVLPWIGVVWEERASGGHFLS